MERILYLLNAAASLLLTVTVECFFRM